MLTDLEITKTKADPGGKEIRLADGEGLHVVVLPTGKKFWRWDYTFNGRRKQLSFGPYPAVTLKQARKKKTAAREVLADGTDPSVARKREKVTASVDTFAAVAAEWLELEAESIGPRTLAKKTSQLERLLLPALGPLTISKIEPTEIWPLLKAIERQGTRDVAHRVRQMASEIFRFAMKTLRAEKDPAALFVGALKPLNSKHRPAITAIPDVAQLLNDIDHADGSPFIVGALKLTPLVFLRPGELRKAEWKEFDLDGAMWRIPARRMKPKQHRLDHLVPLSRQALAILRDLKIIAGTGKLVFPGLKTPDRPFSDATLGTLLRRLGYPKDEQCPHGFRTLASTHLREIGWENDLVELQMDHDIENRVRAVYDKAARVPDRIVMMQAWADHLDAVKTGRFVKFGPRPLPVALAG